VGEIYEHVQLWSSTVPTDVLLSTLSPVSSHVR
jgi:hypothetical protein